MSDAMYAALLADLQPPAAILGDVRLCFVAFCQAHPHHTVRRAWADFKHQLETEINLQTPA